MLHLKSSNLLKNKTMILYNNIFAGKNAENAIKITCDEIKALADNSKLDTSVIYRITDYKITKFSNDTQTSKEHYFDILVTAYNSSKLSPWAGATVHDVDEYYNDMQLRQWYLEYYLLDYTIGYEDNTLIESYPKNPNGIIAYLKDHYNNRARFDFKNLAFNGYLLFDGYDNIDYSQKTDWGVRNFNYNCLFIPEVKLESDQYLNIWGICENVNFSMQNTFFLHDKETSFNEIRDFTLDGALLIKNSQNISITNTNINSPNHFTSEIFNVIFNEISGCDNVNIYDCSGLTINGNLYDKTFKYIRSKTVTVGDAHLYTTKEETTQIIE